MRDTPTHASAVHLRATNYSNLGNGTSQNLTIRARTVLACQHDRFHGMVGRQLRVTARTVGPWRTRIRGEALRICWMTSDRARLSSSATPGSAARSPTHCSRPGGARRVRAAPEWPTRCRFRRDLRASGDGQPRQPLPPLLKVWIARYSRYPRALHPRSSLLNPLERRLGS